jgi:hypothetical protein
MSITFCKSPNFPQYYTWEGGVEPNGYESNIMFSRKCAEKFLTNFKSVEFLNVNHLHFKFKDAADEAYFLFLTANGMPE